MTKHTARWGPSKPISLCLSAILYSSLFVQPPPLLAQDPQQDVAEAARREKARKAALQKKTTHVYTNEDLQQSRILTDEDHERAEARKSDPANAPGKPAMPSFDAENSPAPGSLGEVARRYRAEKAEREAEEAAKSIAPLFPMSIEAPAFAEPMQPVEPTAAPASMIPRAMVAPTAPAKSVPWTNSKPVARAIKPLKRDPFAPQIAVPSLRNSRPEISTVAANPAKPVPPLANVAPHAPSARVESPATAPALSLPAVPRAAQPEIRINGPRRPASLNGNPSVAPALPKSHANPRTPAAPEMVAHASQQTAPLSVAPETKPAAPSVAPQLGVVAPSLPKSHVAPTRTPQLSLPANSSVPSVDTVSEAPTPPTAAPGKFVSRPSVPTTGVSGVVAPKLPPSSDLRGLPPTIAGVPQPVAPSLAPVFEMAVPVAPSSNISAAPAPNIASSIAATAPALGARVAPTAPPIEPALHPATLLVQAGDSLWKLARRRLGRGSRWNEFLAVNPGIVDPMQLQPGTMLVVPADEAQHRTPAENDVVVRSGDSLWKLALVHFGKGTGWTCFAQANPQLQNPNRLEPGQVLKLPATCGR